jgi:hypothetical protein
MTKSRPRNTMSSPVSTISFAVVANRARIPDGLDHHEQCVVVALELGPLVGFQRVLDGELVQPEGLHDGLDLVGVRFMHTDPHEPVAALLDLPDRLGMRPAAGEAFAVDVHRAVHDIGRQRHRARAPDGGVLGAAVTPAAKAAERTNRRHGISWG